MYDYCMQLYNTQKWEYDYCMQLYNTQTIIGSTITVCNCIIHKSGQMYDYCMQLYNTQKWEYDYCMQLYNTVCKSGYVRLTVCNCIIHKSGYVRLLYAITVCNYKSGSTITVHKYTKWEYDYCIATV